MSQQSTALSKGEKKAARFRGARTPPSTLDQLLYSRKQAQQLLGGISIATMQRLEAAGRLRPKRLDPSKTGIGQVFYTRANLLELVGEEGDDDAR
jgi:hypothetical protein